MSYAFLGIDVPVTMGGAKRIEHLATGTPDCGSAIGLQQLLTDLGYYQNGITGYFNASTFAALQRFADDIGLSYTPGYYPGDAQCGAMIMAWQNLQAKKLPYPKAGVPTVMPGYTPEEMVAELQARAAGHGCPECPPCAAAPEPPAPAPPVPAKPPAPPPATHGFWGLDAFGIETPLPRRPRAAPPGLVQRPLVPPGVMRAPPIIQRGDSGPLVKLWQGIVRVPQSGTFDGRTVTATIMWQRSRHISSTGIVGPDSWRVAGVRVRPDGEIAVSGFGGYDGFGAFGAQPTIGVGRANPPAVVKSWQSFLNTILTKPIVVDGVFGSGTKAATIAFQAGAKITADGVVGPGTWAAADRFLASQQPSPGAPAPTAPSEPGAPTPTPSEPGAPPPGGGLIQAPGPIDNAKAWWSSQSKTTQLAVMGGGALALVGLVVLATKEKAA